VDINPQPHYPFEFIQADALDVLDRANPAKRERGLCYWRDIDAIHASPPCQRYTRKDANWGRKRVNVIEHPDLVGPTRELLRATGLPYVIENVPGAPLDAQLELCGTHFGLSLIKHRLFEANWPLPMAPASCDHRDTYNPWSGAGRSAAKLREAQGTPWIPMSGGASRKAGVTGDLFNAIPPAYTEWIGKALLAYIEERAAA
jgi:DNA (cytosine-5)-methyltransferase 1